MSIVFQNGLEKIDFALVGIVFHLHFTSFHHIFVLRVFEALFLVLSYVERRVANLRTPGSMAVTCLISGPWFSGRSSSGSVTQR